MFRASLISLLRKAALLRAGSFVLSVVLFMQSFVVQGSEGLEVSDSLSYRALGGQFAETIAQATKEGCNALFKSRTEINRMLGGLRTDAREIERIAELARRIESGEENVETVRELRGRIQELQASVSEIDSRRESTLAHIFLDIFDEPKSAALGLVLGMVALVSGGLAVGYSFGPSSTNYVAYFYAGIAFSIPFFLMFRQALPGRERYLGHARQQRELRATRIDMLRDFAEGYRTRMTELGLPVDQRLYRALRNGNLARVERMLEIWIASGPKATPPTPTVRVRAQPETTEDSSGSSEQEVVEVDTSSESQDRREVVE